MTEGLTESWTTVAGMAASLTAAGIAIEWHLRKPKIENKLRDRVVAIVPYSIGTPSTALLLWELQLMRQSSVISVSRMTAASLPPNRVENTVMSTTLYSGGASFSSRCIVPVRLVASRM